MRETKAQNQNSLKKSQTVALSVAVWFVILKVGSMSFIRESSENICPFLSECPCSATVATVTPVMSLELEAMPQYVFVNRSQR